VISRGKQNNLGKKLPMPATLPPQISLELTQGMNLYLCGGKPESRCLSYLIGPSHNTHILGSMCYVKRRSDDGKE
jgi:hypothetical protein